jgi:hypothetical protein
MQETSQRRNSAASVSGSRAAIEPRFRAFRDNIPDIIMARQKLTI